MQQTIEEKSSSTAVKVAAVIVSFSLAGVAQAVRAADSPPSPSDKEVLEEVVVTAGSLIPRIKEETSTPITVISAEDIDVKGFANVADALQHQAFSTGSVQGGGFSGGFTQGANTISLFGLDPSYTKFLLDGRPLADYPALYNGSENFVSISGIPTILVDNLSILPGGQSSIYGSDAIAGVVSINLKKKLDGPIVEARYGWTTDGGGVDRRFGVADGFNLGAINILVAGQYENTSPIWGYKRSLTNAYFGGGQGPAVAERDYLVTGYFGTATGNYYFGNDLGVDPGICSTLSSQFGGTLGLQSRAGHGQYCGTTASGFYTIANGSEATQGYLHADLEVNSSMKIFADVLVDHDRANFSTGAGGWFTASDTNPANTYYYAEDPNLGDFVNTQRYFSPEEAGGLNNTMDHNITNSLRATLGVEGDFGGSAWKYSVDFTYTQNRLTEETHLQFENEILAAFAPVYGDTLGYDAPNAAWVYTPNYAALYTPFTPAQYAAFSGYAVSRSQTEESLFRTQVTNAKLFETPGGDAGLAVVAEAGQQGWKYIPDPRYFGEGGDQTYLYTATTGDGHRARYALTSEVRVPIVKMLTADLSGRYDSYRLAGETVDAGTYNLGLEFRPINQVLVRGRYGTSFKAPTLADEFQGPSGFFTTATDWYTCETLGYTAQTIAQCTQAQSSISGVTSGNTALKPITAKNWDLGFVLSPIDRFTFSADWLHWKISNEVAAQNIDTILKTEAACRLGQLDINSPTCQNAISLVSRDNNGILLAVNTPKVNVAEENLTVLLLQLEYTFDLGRAGSFNVGGNYTNIMKHQFTQFSGDTPINLLQDPFYSTEFKTKENLALTWNFHNFGTTLYVEREGRTPNFIATETTSGYEVPGAGRLGVLTLANWSAKYEALPGLVVEFNVDNVFNKMPPTDNSYSGIYNQPYNSLNYNPYGRSFFVQASYKYGKK